MPPAIMKTAQVYRPIGAALDLMYDKSPELILSGPAGTGKTRANLEKLFICADKYAGMRGLILRKTRESLTESALVTWETKVVPERHECLEGPQRKLRQSYVFANGSEITVGGIDKASKIMSTEYDVIYVAEGIELAENDWESLTTRLRNGVMPYQQLIGDTNPDKPRHWLKQRADRGQLKMLESRHEDNPTLWDAKTKQWTPAGAEYIAKLDNLTGPRKPRLRYGRWVQAEGVVYDGYDNNVHLIDRFEIPKSWPRYLVIDFGHTNPFVAMWFAEDPDGRLYRYREIYHTKKLVEDMAKLVKHLSDGEPRPRDVVCDHDAEDRATFERHSGMSTVKAIKDVSPGIQEVAARLRLAEDGKPRIFFLRDSLVARDPELASKAKPCCTDEEWDGYVWDVTGSSKKGEVPSKPQDDHGMDCVRYLCQWIAGKPKGGGVDQISFPEKANILDDLPPDLWHAV
jgi:phage terminase large subunit